MPFYFRKSISAGPFRFNFSKGGIGASVGVKGFRVGTGPRGHYVHAGLGGFYYRSTVGKAGDAPARRERRKHDSVAFNSEYSQVELKEVESGDVLEMRDETFASVLDELNAKQRQVRLSTLLCTTVTAVAVATAFTSFPAALVMAGAAALAWLVGNWFDSYRRSTVLYYDLGDTQQPYQGLIGAFDDLAACAGIWHVEAGGAVQDLMTWKRNSGATHIVKKQPTTLSYRLPSVIKCNITPPAMKVGRQVIYFMPDVALVEDRDAFGAVTYVDLQIESQHSNFIEEGVVPKDAEVVGHTWKHPNKSGGPDRRFNNNHQIPICRYEAMHLKSTSGLNEMVEFSRQGVAAPFAHAIRAFCAADPAGTSQRSARSIR